MIFDRRATVNDMPSLFNTMIISVLFSHECPEMCFTGFDPRIIGYLFSNIMSKAGKAGTSFPLRMGLMEISKNAGLPSIINFCSSRWLLPLKASW